MSRSPERQVEHYLKTGDYDMLFTGWPGGNIITRCQTGDAAMRQALVAEVRRRTRHARAPKALAGLDVVALTRAKVAPMVRGLFPQLEQAIVLRVLERSVVFLTPITIYELLAETHWLHTAWHLANLYLGSCGADLLSKKETAALGMSEETTCYVTMAYFGANDRFDDFVVHEAAHIFHNCKRTTIGLPETRRREWLLPIDFVKRETFAYACETYGRILELSDTRSARQRLLAELEVGGPMPPTDTVERGEYIDILREAVSARNGWKRILQRCAPPRPPSRREFVASLVRDFVPAPSMQRPRRLGRGRGNVRSP